MKLKRSNGRMNRWRKCHQLSSRFWRAQLLECWPGSLCWGGCLQGHSPAYTLLHVATSCASVNGRGRVWKRCLQQGCYQAGYWGQFDFPGAERLETDPLRRSGFLECCWPTCSLAISLHCLTPLSPIYTTNAAPPTAHYSARRCRTLHSCVRRQYCSYRWTPAWAVHGTCG